MINESIDRRVLGGLVFVDAITNASIVNPLQVSSAQLQLKGNRSGIYVIFNGPNLDNLTYQFNPVVAAWPGPQNFEITVQDSSLRYLSRRAQVQAPQPLASAFTPQPIPLYPSAAADVAPNWAVIRASVTGTSGAGLPWAIVQAIKSDNTVAATGMTDSRGEALLAIPGLGLQVSADASGSVTEVTIPITVQAWFDPSVLQQPPGWIPDPAVILSNLADPKLKTGKITGALGPKQILLAPIAIST